MIIDGSSGVIRADSIVIKERVIHIEGINNAEIDFSPSVILEGEDLEDVRNQMLERAKNNQPYAALSYIDKELSKQVKLKSGFYIENSKEGSIKNIKIKNTQYAGIMLFKCENYLLENVEVQAAQGRGFNIEGKKEQRKASQNITLRKCWAHDCYDSYLLGEESDGFFIGEGAKNVLVEDCLAEFNADTGFDTCSAYGEITFIRCVARYNGFTKDMVKNKSAKAFIEKKNASNKISEEPDSPIDIGADGQGWTTAFIGTSHLRKFINDEIDDDMNYYTGKITLKDCISYSNSAWGITRSNGPAPLYFENTYSLDNGNGSYMLQVTSDNRTKIANSKNKSLKAAYEKLENVADNSFERNIGKGKSWTAGKASYDSSKLYILPTDISYEEACRNCGITLPQALDFIE